MKFVATIVFALIIVRGNAQTDPLPPHVECPYPLELERDFSTATPASPDTTIFSYTDEMPMFPGGDSAWKAFIKSAVIYPVIARDSAQQGTVYVQFTVETDGLITNCIVRRHPQSLPLAAEALRVVCSSPKWIPGKQDGKAVRVQMIMPIRFVLPN